VSTDLQSYAVEANQGTHLDADANRINLSWLLKLRWGAIAGQVVTILVVNRVLEISLPLGILFAIISVELASNIAFAFWVRKKPMVGEAVVTVLMAADVLLLTALLYETGGPFNPFNFLYLVHIALATVVLSARSTWGLVGLALACFGVLFIQPSASGSQGHEHHLSHSGSMQMHMQGMGVAFAVAAAFIVYFVTRVTRDLARRERELAHARSRAARAEKLVSLATLAAGAAHELSTPLATIAVVAKELERDLERGASGKDKSADARVIREVVDRCQEILGRMAADAGHSAGEGFSQLSIDELVTGALSRFPGREAVRVAIEQDACDRRMLLPPHAVTRALCDVLENAQQAIASGGEVALRAQVQAGQCRIEVKDSGVGMSPEVLARAGEPFFTTKEPGQGMGLGLFVTRAVLERLGGKLELASAKGEGTSVVLTLPLSSARDNSPQASPSQSLAT
jgi:two-component system, sensor histidine kinase RegB